MPAILHLFFFYKIKRIAGMARSRKVSNASRIAGVARSYDSLYSK